MKLLSSRGLSGLAAVADITRHATRKKPASGRDIAARLGLPQRHLEPLLQDLVHGEVLAAIRGPNGGYHLSRAASKISVYEILEAILQPISFTPAPGLIQMAASIDGLEAKAFEELKKTNLMSFCGLSQDSEDAPDNITTSLPPPEATEEEPVLPAAAPISDAELDAIETVHQLDRPTRRSADA